MKFFALSLVLLCSPAFADVSDLDVIKSRDGKAIYCSTEADLGVFGYRPLDIMLAPAGSGLRLSTTVHGLVCKNENRKIAFAPRNLADPVRGQNRNGIPYTELFRELRFLVIDSQYKIIGAVDVQNVPAQAIAYEFPLASTFSKPDLARLERGETLKVTWQFFLQGIHSLQTPTQTIPLGLFAGGSFYINFDLRLQNGALEVLSFRVN